MAWTTVSILVGTFLHTIAERLKLAGPIVRWLLGLAWALATAFVVPVLVIEGTSVRRGVRRSAGLFRSRWGETATARVGIGVLVFVVSLVACPVVALLAVVSVPVALVAGIVTLAGALALTGALDGVLTAALYRYAAEGGAVGPFSEHDLASRYAAKRSRV